MKKIPVLSLLTTLSVLAPIAQASDLNINGFLSVGASMLDSKDVTLEGADTNGGFKNDTVLGLQVSKQVNGSTTVTGQLVSRGAEDYKTEAAWAYVNYAVNNDLDLRMGRLRVPFFYYSDFLEVGYAYDWIRPPSEVYIIPFSSVDGVDLSYRFTLGSFDNNAQLYYGRYSPESGSVELRNFTGLALTSTTGDLSFRASYHRMDLFINEGGAAMGGINNPASPIHTGLLANGYSVGDINAAATEFQASGEEATFYGIAAGYDNGDISFITEITGGTSDSPLALETSNFLAKVGKRISDMTLHLTYSSTETETLSGIDGAIQEKLNLENKQNSIIAGMRWDYDSSTALKFEVQQHNEELVAGIGENKESGMMYSIAVDLVF